jgi:DNA-binding IclR family transcriptional regulator
VPAVQAEVAECRARGYAAGGITASPDMTSLAMSLPSGGSEVGLVLGFAGRFLQREAELAHVLRSCIKEILGPASDADPS